MTPQTLAAADPAMVRRWLATPQTVRQADYLKLQAVIDDPTLDPELRADLRDVLPLYREAASYEGGTDMTAKRYQLMSAQIEIDDAAMTASARFWDSRGSEPFVIYTIEDDREQFPGVIMDGFSVTDSSDADPAWAESWDEAQREFRRQVAAFIAEDWGEGKMEEDA